MTDTHGKRDFLLNTLRATVHASLSLANALRLPALAGLPAPSNRDAMQAWSVRDVVQFYESKDASGLATTLDQNAVCGSDLLAFGSWQEVQTELRLTPFAAKKAVSLRDAFLGM